MGESVTMGETQKIQLASALQDPWKEKPWATGPYAQTHSISNKLFPLGNEENSQDYALKYQWSQTEAVNQSQSWSRFKME